jgi:hypothetical protein
MNAKQRRRLVRQYKEAINIDRAVCRLEGSLRWFDSRHPTQKHMKNPTPELDYYYALYVKAKEKHNDHL